MNFVEFLLMNKNPNNLLKKILLLTRDRSNPSFRQRIEPYLNTLKACNILCDVQELKKSTIPRLKQFKSSSQYDALFLHRKTLNFLDALIVRKYARKIFYDFDDAIIYRAQSKFTKPHSSRLRKFKRTVKLASIIFAGNPVLEKQSISCQTKGQVIMIPTGLDTSRYIIKDYSKAEIGNLRIVWIGSKSTLKQVRTFSSTLEQLGREIDNIILRIIADDELEIPGLKIENLKWTREDEVRLINESDIAIAPLPDTPFARGKCAFKVLQYMACGIPTVTSPIGANARYIEHEKTGFHATDDLQWISYIKRLAGDSQLRQEMGLRARKAAEKEFDFNVLRETFCNPIEKLLTNGN